MVWLLLFFFCFFFLIFFFFSSRRRHTRLVSDWSSDVCSSDLHIDSYEMVRVDRIGRSGGGILCYLKSGLKFKVLSHFDHILEESITVRIDFISSCSLLICFVYRHPSSRSSWNDQLKIYLENCTQYCMEIMILGDFNMNLMVSKVEKRWMQDFFKILI